MFWVPETIPTNQFKNFGEPSMVRGPVFWGKTGLAMNEKIDG